MNKKLIIFLSIYTFLGLLMLVIYFLASTDLYDHYVSSQIGRFVNLNGSHLPDWTRCELQWKALSIELFIRVPMLIVILLVLFRMFYRNLLTIWVFLAQILTFITFLTGFFYFLGSTDVYHDYISNKAIKALYINNADFPVWTNCFGEWTLMQIDFFARIFHLCLIGFILYLAVQKFKLQSNRG
jgi:hypothetical protein